MPSTNACRCRTGLLLSQAGLDHNMRVNAAVITVLLVLATPACEAEYGLTATEPAVGPSSPPTQPPSQLPPGGSAGAPGGEIIRVDDSLLAPVVSDMEAAASTASMPSMGSVPPANDPTTAPIETLIEPAPSAPPAPPADGSNEEGDLRLAGRVDINGYATGALHVFLDGAFGAVCVNEFGPADADVACRQMGFVGGTAVPLALRGAGPLGSDEVLQEIIAPFVLENLDCAGTEARLLDCPSVMEFERDYQYTTVFGDTYSVADRSGLTTCSALRAGYAFVACGMTEGPGVARTPLAVSATGRTVRTLLVTHCHNAVHSKPGCVHACRTPSGKAQACRGLRPLLARVYGILYAGAQSFTDGKCDELRLSRSCST
eukprot:jgi/Ulvmu1/9435/UM051_0063.1